GSRKQPSGADRRAWVRHACDNAIAFQPLAERTREIWRAAKITNISTKGIGLILHVRMERGAILSVQFEGASARFTRPILVRVVRTAERTPGVWQIGCSFAIPLGEDELRDLLPGKDVPKPVPEKKKLSGSRLRRRPPPDTHDPFVDGSV